jgi:hypothetical protein
VANDAIPFGEAVAEPRPQYQRWGVPDRAKVGDGYLTLWAVDVGECMFFVHDKDGQNHTLWVGEDETKPLPGVAGWSVELLGCRPKAMRSHAWAALRLVRT